jgi:hypothetical protein
MAMLPWIFGPRKEIVVAQEQRICHSVRSIGVCRYQVVRPLSLLGIVQALRACLPAPSRVLHETLPRWNTTGFGEQTHLYSRIAKVIVSISPCVCQMLSFPEKTVLTNGGSPTCSIRRSKQVKLAAEEARCISPRQENTKIDF